MGGKEHATETACGLQLKYLLSGPLQKVCHSLSLENSELCSEDKFGGEKRKSCSLSFINNDWGLHKYE